MGGRLIRYFIQGVVMVAPVTITLYIIYLIVSRIDSIIPFEIPGLGFALVIGIILIVGMLSETIIMKPVFTWGENLILKTPGAKVIYTSLKDLIATFTSKESKFKYPVLVTINKSGGIQKLGFISQRDLSALGMPDKVAVYLPHSYNFSGNMFVVSKDAIEELKDVDSTVAMKFIVSGGMTSLEEITKSNEEQ